MDVELGNLNMRQNYAIRITTDPGVLLRPLTYLAVLLTSTYPSSKCYKNMEMFGLLIRKQATSSKSCLAIGRGSYYVQQRFLH